MTVLAVAAGDVAYWALAFFLVAVGVASFFMLSMLGGLFGRISAFVKGTERDLLPVIVKAGGTVDRINYQLDKADTVTDSAVSMADSADTAVRAVSHAITKPVEKLSGVAAGISHGVAAFREHHDLHEASAAYRQAARQRRADLAEDLQRAATPGTAPRPEPTPPPAPPPTIEPWPRPARVPKPEPAPEPPRDRDAGDTPSAA